MFLFGTVVKHHLIVGNITAITIRKMSQEFKALTAKDEAERFMIDCLKAVGVNHENAETVALNLLEADYRGHFSHGMNRLDYYIRDIQGGVCCPNATPTIEHETVATATVNGNNGLGAVIGKFCMDLAIKKAKDAGISLVVAHGSNHFGIAGWYTLQAIKEGCLGMSFTNSSPFMVPTRGKEAALGTNPISLGAPGLNGDSYVLDMATTAVAVGKIELARRKGTPIPEGWAMNDQGKIETNPDVAYKARKLMPLGGTELHSGYKGFGLGVLVEIFSAILSGANAGTNVREWDASTEVANLGHAFIAINPSVFTPGFEQRLSCLMDQIRCMPQAEPDKPILIPGDPEKIHMKQVDEEGGLGYVKNQHETNAKLAKQLNVKPMESIQK